MADQIWRPVVGYEGLYEVSNKGRVRNPRTGTVYAINKNLVRGVRAYPIVNLRGHDGVTRTIKVHRLVAIAFIPNPNGLREVNHIDGDKANNLLENLEWMSPLDNYYHGQMAGRSHAGTNPRMARKYSPEVITAFKSLTLAPHACIVRLADAFGMSRGYAWKVAHGRMRARG